MARLRRKHNYFDEVDNHERWLVSYADFVTLLFAFFLVMYSISSEDFSQYKKLTNALNSSFGERDKVIESEIVQTEIVETIEPIEVPEIVVVPQDKKLSNEILKERLLLEKVSKQLNDALQDYIKDDQITVIRNDFWVELQMNSQLLFLSGEAHLSSDASLIFKKVAELIASMPNVVSIEGHTDNVPIENKLFSSNWELSSARATSVVREFINNGISPQRLSAVGYGEFHPVADNNTEDGRAQNRRVVLVLVSQTFSRYGISDEERAKLLNLVDDISIKE